MQKRFIELDSRLVEDYLETRRDPIVCSIEPGMYSGFFDWSECPRPTGVRPYVKLCLVEVVAVHAELHRFEKIPNFNLGSTKKCTMFRQLYVHFSAGK